MNYQQQNYMQNYMQNQPMNQNMGNMGYQQPYQPQYQQNNMQMPPVSNWNRPVMTPPMMSNYPSLPGRTIGNPQEIRPNEVMMDGTPSLFPMSDYSCIYAKSWGSDGNIQTVKFVPEKVEVVPEGPSNFDLLMERLTNIEKMLQNQNNRKPYYNKKEADNNAN